MLQPYRRENRPSTGETNDGRISVKDACALIGAVTIAFVVIVSLGYAMGSGVPPDQLNELVGKGVRLGH